MRTSPLPSFQIFTQLQDLLDAIPLIKHRHYVAVIDIDPMKEEDISALIEEVLRLTPAVAVLLLSANPSYGLYMEAMLSGCSGVITPSIGRNLPLAILAADQKPLAFVHNELLFIHFSRFALQDVWVPSYQPGHIHPTPRLALEVSLPVLTADHRPYQPSPGEKLDASTLYFDLKNQNDLRFARKS